MCRSAECSTVHLSLPSLIPHCYREQTRPARFNVQHTEGHSIPTDFLSTHQGRQVRYPASLCLSFGRALLATSASQCTAQEVFRL